MPWVLRVAWLLSTVLWIGACGDEAQTQVPGICADADGDGRGVGCLAGPDCDDDDARRSVNCGEAGPASECEAQPLAAACPCLRGDEQACFFAAAERRDVGPCQAGRTTCSDGLWGPCEGAVLPVFEACNGIDDDCDGYTDEGVESPCGGCNPDCHGGVWGPPSAPFTAEEPLAVTSAGELSLRWQTHPARTLWIPNTDEGSVSKLDAAEARELARYRTEGRYPIRVAVDHRPDAFVLDGTFQGSAHLSKFAGETKRCRQGLSSSTGPDDVLPLGREGCLLFDVPLERDADPRSLAVDGALAPDLDRAGDVWIGLAGSRELAHLDGSTGQELARYALPDFRPTASAFDPFGVLWSIDRAGVLLRFDPLAPADVQRFVVPFACYTLEALSIDAAGRLYMSGFGCERVFSYEPARDVWRELVVPQLQSPRGIIALSDDTAWLAYDSGQVARLARDPLAVADPQPLAAEGAQPFETFALTADGLGQLWAVSTQGGVAGRGLVTRFDPQRGAVSAQLSVGLGPRASGDFSGYASGGEYARSGSARHVFGGCGREGRGDEASGQGLTIWRRLRIAAQLGLGAEIVVSLRHAGDEAGLAALSFEPLGSLPGHEPTFELALEQGGAIEVQLELHSPVAIGAPRISRVGVEWDCPGPD